MSLQSINRVVFVAAFSSVALTIGLARAHEGHGGGQATRSRPSPPREDTRRVSPPPAERQAVAPVHGGQLVKGQWQYFEVVYLPRETRLYLYADTFRPLSARGVGGEVVMQVRGNSQVFRYPLRYSALPAGSMEQDYLVAVVDVTQVRDGDMQATFSLVNLPEAREPSVRFAQTFALARAAAVVTRVPITAADRDAVARQGTCPVMEGGFDHGEPIKLMIGNQALFVCCEACIEEVEKNPQVYLQKVARLTAMRAAPSAGPARVVATRAGDQDRAAIQAQGLCPVMNQPLGAHGVPWKLSVQGQDIFVCCAGCIRKVEQDPQRYLAQVRASQSRR